ncbi:MAG TPA: hypothetical protein VM489_01590 [Burkholderiales bacterium]|nr:hypothetical protein [Burkholderiales bacterium]
MADKAKKKVVQALLERHGRTFAVEAGIRLRHAPAPLFRLLVLSMLLSARIAAGNAVRAAKALVKKYGTPKKLAGATWQQRVDVLTSHGYKRYDESGADQLGDTAQRVLDEYGRLKAFKGIGNVGADIFLREVQGVWDEFQPYADKRVLRAAKRLKLGGGPKALARLVDKKHLPRLEAALVRVELAGAHDQIRAQAS